MRLLVIIIMTMFAVQGVSAQTTEDVQYTRQDSLIVMELLHHLKSKADLSDTVIYIARQLTGKPYVAKTLEGNSKERLVVNLRQLDCTTYVENVLALYLCCKQRRWTFRDFCTMLRSIRYADGRVSYTSRLHYFSQWIDHNTAQGIVAERQQPNPPFAKTQTLNINYMSQHPKSYPMLAADTSLINDIAREEGRLSGKTVRYIAKGDIDNSELLRSTIHDGDILAIVTNKAGLDISHMGIAVWHEDGLHLLNASMTHKKVVEERLTLREYMSRHASQVGIRVVKIKGLQ